MASTGVRFRPSLVKIGELVTERKPPVLIRAPTSQIISSHGLTLLLYDTYSTSLISSSPVIYHSHGT